MNQHSAPTNPIAENASNATAENQVSGATMAVSTPAVPTPAVPTTGANSDSPLDGPKSKSILTEKETRLASRVVIFSVLFGVTGALGLPLLWFSKHFSGVEKAFWSLIVLLYTFLLIAGTLGICWWALNQLFPDGGFDLDSLQAP